MKKSLTFEQFVLNDLSISDASVSENCIVVTLNGIEKTFKLNEESKAEEISSKFNEMKKVSQGRAISWLDSVTESNNLSTYSVHVKNSYATEEINIFESYVNALLESYEECEFVLENVENVEKALVALEEATYEKEEIEGLTFFTFESNADLQESLNKLKDVVDWNLENGSLEVNEDNKKQVANLSEKVRKYKEQLKAIKSQMSENTKGLKGSALKTMKIKYLKMQRSILMKIKSAYNTIQSIDSTSEKYESIQKIDERIEKIENTIKGLQAKAKNESFDEFYGDFITESELEDDVPGLEESTVNEEEKVETEAEFRAYAEKLLKKAHGEDYDADKAKEMIDGLLDKYKDDFGAMVGALQGSLSN